MRDEEMLQKLLRLKRYETPGDDYFERFLDEFHARMARESRARHGVKDRVFAWLEELFPSPRLGWSAAAGGMMAVVAFAFLVSNHSPMGANKGMANKEYQRPEVPSGMDIASANTGVLPPVPPVPAPPAVEPTAPTPIIFPELMAPVSYSFSRANGTDGPVNLTSPVILRREDRDKLLHLQDTTTTATGSGAANNAETILILDQNAEPQR